jgi:hypothetical protein
MKGEGSKPTAFTKRNPMAQFAWLRFLASAVVFFAAVGCSSSLSPGPSATAFQTNRASAVYGAPERRRRRFSSVSPVVYSFPKNGANYPSGPLYVAPGGIFFGTTEYYSTNSCRCSGAVFSITPQSSGPPVVTVIFIFPGPSPTGGLEPQTGVVRGPDGALYGTTVHGGPQYGSCLSASSGACGVLFKLTKQASSWNETVLQTFTGNKDGAAPSGPPLLLNGTLYGVTQAGGCSGSSCGGGGLLPRFYATDN